jgi:hypothetical protein
VTLCQHHVLVKLLEMEFASSHPQDGAEYYYDLSSGQLLLGGIALDAHFEAGGNPADIRELGPFLRSDEAIPHKERWGTRFTGYGNEEILQVSRWLYDVVPEPENPNQKRFTKRIINRASYLDIHPSVRQLRHPDRFGSTSNFFRALGKISANIMYHNVTTDSAIDYVKRKHDELGRMPTERELNALATESSENISYDVLAERIPGGLSRVAKELDYVIARKDSDYIDWGVEFYAANDFLFPSQDLMYMFRDQGKSPGYANTKKRWTMDDYKALIKKNYDEQLLTLKAVAQAKSFPHEIYHDIHDDYLVATRCTRYMLVCDFAPLLSEEQKIELSVSKLTDGDFAIRLQQYNAMAILPLITERAEQFGVFKNFWRWDYLKSLEIASVINRKLDQQRGILDSPMKDEMEDAIDMAVDFLVANKLGELRKSTIRFLQKKRLIPGKRRFEYIFQNQTYFNLLVKQKLKRSIVDFEQEQEEADHIIESYLQANALPAEIYYNIAPGNDNEEVADIIRKSYQEGLDPSEKTGKIIMDAPLTNADFKIRVAKFMLSDTLLPGVPIEEKIIISILSRSRSFQSEIKNKDSNLHSSDIEHEARRMGIANYVYSVRSQHIDRLRNLYRQHRNSGLRRNYHQRKHATILP